MIKKALNTILFFLSLSCSVEGQINSIEISVKIPDYTHDTLWLGRLQGKRSIPDFFAIRQADSTFKLMNDKPITEGVYAIIYKNLATSSDMDYIPCWITEKDNHFSIETSLRSLYVGAKVQGSSETASLLSYLFMYNMLSDSLDRVTEDFKSQQSEKSFQIYVRHQENLKRYQEDFVKNNAHVPLTAALVKETTFLTPPSPTTPNPDFKKEVLRRHLWFRNHFFDRMALNNERFLKQPLWVDRTDYYFTKLPPPHPDSTVAMVEDIIQKMESNPKILQYYFNYMMNSLAKVNRFRNDEAYVTLVNKHVKTQTKPWLNEKRVPKYMEEANKLEPLLMGKKVEDAVFTDKNGKDVSLYEQNAPYTLMVFWLHDCSHCKKEMQVLMLLYEKFWKAKGLKILAVCGNSGEHNTKPCFDFAEKMKLPAEWQIVNDPVMRSQYVTKYNIRSYPRMILLDSNKKVLFKYIGEISAKSLDAEVKRVIK